MASETIVGEGDNGTTVTLSIASHNVAVIRLPANPTTGFNWAVEQCDAAILELTNEFEPPPRTLCGAGGIAVIKLRPLTPGTTQVRLGYKRSWEHHPASKVFTVTVVVS
ncbi:hypothetical protein Pelo_16217 [Pelomyxa schiedti]|nr:hypothetical protein Pelo_16217 [Pelomyxa schiedti]